MTVVDMSTWNPVVLVLVAWPLVLIAWSPWAAMAVYVAGIAVMLYVTHYFVERPLDDFGAISVAAIWPAYYYIGIGYAAWRLLRWAVRRILPVLDGIMVRFLTRTIDKNAMGKLIEQRWSRGRIRRYLIVHDETGEHAIPIPPPRGAPIENVLDAIAWTFTAEEGEYQPVIEV